MIAGAVGSALSGSFWVLIGFRFQLQVQGRARQAASQLTRLTGVRAFLSDRRCLIMLAGTAGCWFLLETLQQPAGWLVDLVHIASLPRPGLIRWRQ